MRRNSSQFALAAVSLLCILILAACSTAPVLQYIAISPLTATISAGNSQQFTATAYYSDGSRKDGSALVTWGSSNQTVATIDNSGVATALAPGSTTITAAAAGTPGASATLNVNQLLSITVSPATATISAGQTQQYSAMGTFKNPDGTSGPPTDITSLVDSVNGWNSGTPAVATIDNTGLATGVATGSTAITATLYGVTSAPAANLTVGPPVALSLVVSPATPTIAVGNALTFTAQEKWSDNTLHPLSGTVTWSSDTPASAMILANSGIATGFATGTPNITATEGALTGSTALTVVAGTAHFAYISNTNDTDIQWYAVNAATSPYLTGGGNTGNAGYDPVQTVIHPSGNYLYAISTVSDVYLYDIAPSSSVSPAPGTLTLTNPVPQSAGSGNTNFGVIDPYGRFLYVSDDVGGTIFGFQISPTDGSLTAIQGSPFTTNLNLPESLVIDHSGTYLYVTNAGGSGTVSIYTIDQTATATAGALTPLAGQPSIATGLSPQYAALHPSGNYLYVANQDNTVSAYSIDTVSTDPTAGQLTPLAGSPYTIDATATDVLNVVVDPSGKYLYVLDAGGATGQVFSYNLSAGVVGSEIGTGAATGQIPFSFAVDPTGAILVTANSFDVPGTLSLFSITGGALGTGAFVPSDTAASQSPGGSDPLWIAFYNAP